MDAAHSVARRVDHINIRVSDPRPLFALLVDRLQLPVLWRPAALPGFMRDGKILRSEIYLNREEALEAAGLSQ